VACCGFTHSDLGGILFRGWIFLLLDSEDIPFVVDAFV
jgi:hypothetical protein